MYQNTLRELSAALHNKAISSRELVNHYFQRIEQYASELNCFITLCKEQALMAATEADKQLATGTATALTGIPIAHKDIFCTQGIKTSCGSKMLDNFIAPYDATLVTRMQQAGCIMLGKANMDEFAMGSSNENSYYGPVLNPWDKQCVPGGSSGGSAAAVAARLVAAATGTDTGGSIRQPAALCGITGLKPTYGRISRYGMIAFASSLDQAGPMTQTAEDAALLLNAMAGFDEKDSTSVDCAVPDYTATLTESIAGLRIGIVKEFFNAELHPEIAAACQQAASQLEKLGAILVDINLPQIDAALPAYYVIAPAECSSNLARFDGVRYGYRCNDPKDLTDLYKRSRGEAFGDEVKRRIMIGTYTLSAGYYDAYYRKAQQIRRLIKNQFSDALQHVDMLLGPTTPSTAFKLGEKTADPMSMYLADIYTIAVNLAGLPALSMPCGFSNKMPVGVQLIANYFQEARLLNVAHCYQQQTDWHKQIPKQYL